MTTDEKLDRVLGYLAAIQRRLDVIPDADEIGVIQDTLDEILHRVAEQEERQVLMEIRQSVRRVS